MICVSSVVFSASNDVYKYSHYIEGITSNIPNMWELQKSVKEHVHYGFHNDKIKGELYIFTGPKTVYWNNKDKAGKWNKNGLAKESINLWIMPADYSPGWRTYFRIGEPKLPRKIFSPKDIKVYAETSHYISDQPKFKKLLNESTDVYWDKIESITWENWESDIVKSIDKIK